MKKTAHLFLGILLFAFSYFTEFPINTAFAVNNGSTLSFGDLLNGKYAYPTAVSTDKNVKTKSDLVNTLLTNLNNISASDPSNIKNNLKLQKLYANTLKNYSLTSPTPTKTLTEDVKSALDKIRLDLSVTPSSSPTADAIGYLNKNPLKTTYTFAVLGDSMVDTLGKNLPQLKQLLKVSYPKYNFALLNYGFGSTTIEDGLYRLTHGTKYLSKYYPPLLSFKPDFLVIESFAYNHWTGEKYDLDRQWLTIAKIRDAVKEKSPQTKIILASAIAPNALRYGDGVLNWSKDMKWQSAQITKSYLENLNKFAISEKLPLADAFNPSLGKDGNGLAKYINSGDNLHPSDEGKLLFSQKIIDAMKSNNLLK